jgi:hypothetical protein
MELLRIEVAPQTVGQVFARRAQDLVWEEIGHADDEINIVLQILCRRALHVKQVRLSGDWWVRERPRQMDVESSVESPLSKVSFGMDGRASTGMRTFRAFIAAFHPDFVSCINEARCQQRSVWHQRIFDGIMGSEIDVNTCQHT